MRKIHLMTTGLYGLIFFGCVAGAAVAQTVPQTAPQTAPAPAPSEDTTVVTIKGAKPTNRIDRQVYDNKDQIDSTSGTASDALSKVPSVNVDPNGNVTLRGNSNVQVYVDGKPSVMMQGDNRAGALQAMSSGDIDSIEVMTNPGAQFSAEGSGGIINLVMRKNRKPGNSGSLNANIGDNRYNASLNGSRNSGKYTVSGGLSVRHDTRPGRSGSILQRRDVNGNIVNSTEQNGQSTGSNDNISASAGFDYNLSATDSIGTQLSFSHRENDGLSDNTYATYDATGAAQNRYDRHSTSQGIREDSGFGIRWDHTGSQTGETLKADLRIGRSSGGNSTLSANTYSLGGTDSTDTRRNSSDYNNSVLSVDYVRPIGNDQLSTGVQITHDTNTFNNLATGAGASGLTSVFSYDQTLSAAYVTYQKPIGDKWIVMGGLRAEALDLDTNAVTSQTTSHTAYTKFVPSAFATYALTDNSKLRFSYSHRLQRPNPQDLNPFRVYVDPQNVSQGNPDLKPQETDSFELGYEVTGTMINYQVRGYYRKNDNSITSYSYFESPGVLLTTKRNFGSGESGGIEGNFNGKLTPKLSVNANGNLAFTQLTTPNVAGTQKATTLSGRVSLDYQATLKDRVQFSYFSSGKQLTGQGYRSPFMMGNMSYRHQVTPKAALVVNVNDPFRTGKFRMVTDTDTIYSESYNSRQGPTIMAGLSYLLGGPSTSTQQQRQGFDGRGQGGNWRGPGG